MTMINTNELMLGNLVEYRGKYVTICLMYEGVVSVRHHDTDTIETSISQNDINPIKLTTEIIERLGLVGFYKKTLHEWQNARTIHGRHIDITPLLKPKPILTTHDGVELFDRDATVWVCSKEGVYFNTKNKNKPNMYCASHDFSNLAYNFLVFSTESACQSYINTKWEELHPESIFVTEDGVGIYNNQTYYYCRKTGFEDGRICAICSNSRRFVDGMNTDLYVYFSTCELAQAYLNKVWAETEYQSLLKSTQCQNK